MSESVTVKFGLQLIQIGDLDEKNQVLVTNMRQIYEWVDNQLVWAPAEYGNVSDIRLPVNEIWTPDVVLYNHADTRVEEKREVMCKVYYNGTVVWRPMSIFKSTCQIDIKRFPYDEQTCSMKFGSWTYDASKINLTFWRGMRQFDMSEFVSSNEWEIVNKSAMRNIKMYSCCPEEYPDLTFFIRLRRRGGFYNYILVLPCVLLSCLTMVLFWLPPESPAKMVLGMNIFTSFFVLLLLLYRNMPSSSKSIPLIGAYYCLNMATIATSSILCAIVVHIYYRGSGPLPIILRKIFLECLTQFFRMEDSASLTKHSKLKSGSTARLCEGSKFEKFELLRTTNDTVMVSRSAKKELPVCNSTFITIDSDIKEIRDYLRQVRKRSEENLCHNRLREDWIKLSLVLDRTFFFIYLIVMLLSLIIMFPR